MKQKRRITSIYNKLLKAEQTEETLLALQILGWVLEDNDLKFEDIISGVEEPKSRLANDIYAYDSVQMVWKMKNPFDPEKVYITYKIPDYTPKSWWELVELDKIKEGIVFGVDYLKVRDNLPGDKISWVEIPKLFQEHRELFSKQILAEKYLLEFYEIDYSDKIEVSATERRDFQRRTNCNPKFLREEIEKEYNADWVYIYKEKGERIWAMRKRPTE